jgi:hypothetical protein
MGKFFVRHTDDVSFELTSDESQDDRACRCHRHCGEQESRSFSPRSKMVSKYEQSIITKAIIWEFPCIQMTLMVRFMAFLPKSLLVVLIDCSYLRFSYPFRPRAETATFCSPQCHKDTHRSPPKFSEKKENGPIILLLLFVNSPMVCSPNEDLGRIYKRWNPDFRYTFQWFVAQIEYSRPWKVLPSKSGFPRLFPIPKSSFGRDKW